MPFRLSGGNDLQGAQLLANIMALPETLGNQRIEASQMRGLLRQMGEPQNLIDLYAPGEDTPVPVGGTGVAGKVLSGVGKTGAVLSTILGAPVKAPRVDFGEATSAMQQGYREDLAGMETDPRKKALLRLGQYGTAYGGAGSGEPKNLIGLLYAQGKSLGYEGNDLTNYVFRKYPEMQGVITGARKDVTVDIDSARKRWEDENKRRNANGLPSLPPPAGGFGDSSDSGSGTPGSGIQGGDGDGIPRARAGRLSPIDPRFDAVAAKYNLPRGLLNAVAQTESSFNPHAVGPVTPGGWQARGLMQFSPDTARLYGLDDPHDPDKALDASGRYLRDLLNRNGGDVRQALQQYGGAIRNDYASPVLARMDRYQRAFARGESPAGEEYARGDQAPLASVSQQAAGPPPTDRLTSLWERDLAARVKAGWITQAQMDAELAKAQPPGVQVASNDPTVGFPPGAPGPEDTRGLRPLPTDIGTAPAGAGTPGAAVSGAPAPAAAPAAAAPPPPPPPPAGPGVPAESGGLPVKEKKMNIGGTDYTYEQLSRAPEWNEAAQRLRVSPDVQGPDADKIAGLVREEKRLGEKMDLFDLGALANGLPLRGGSAAEGTQWSPAQADQVRAWMRQYENEPSLRGQMARMRMVRLTLERLRAPVQEQDRHTLRPKVDADGNPVYARKPNGEYLTPIETLTENPLIATMPFYQAARLAIERRLPGGEAINQLLMAQGEMANFVKAAGDSGNASEKEQANQLDANIPNERDTVESALFKVNQGLQRVQDYEHTMSSQFRARAGDDTANIGGPTPGWAEGKTGAPQLPPGFAGSTPTAAPSAPAAPAAPTPRRPMSLEDAERKYGLVQ